MKPRDWVLFWSLGLIWGSSFLWIKIALQGIGPFGLVAWRLLIGVAGLAVVVAVRRPAFPRQRRIYGMLALLGLTNTALPFLLISWGEQSIDSAVASILNGTVPLFAMVIAHFALQDDRMTRSRVVGLILGFLGVVVLMSGELTPGGFARGGLGQLAVLLAAILYAFSGVFARKNLHGLSPVVQAFVPLIVADAFIWTGAIVAEAPVLTPSIPLAWFALLWLGLLGSCVAYLLYFSLLHSVGPTRATMVTYVFPVVGLVLGIIFLHEPLTLNLLIGAAMVVAGILVVNGAALLRSLSSGGRAAEAEA
ncbi:MAG TPA: DMT family transporter [Anaerolineales bacterium]|nr:DMT family transporter [Anaerolineales bacterium]